MSDLTQIRVKDQPLHCSACFQQEPGLHVDFNTAYDGPVVNQIAIVSEGAEAVAIDDLVLCERCLKTAAKAIGLVEAPDLVSELERIRGENAQLQEDRQKDKTAISRLQQAIDAMAERKYKGRSKVVEAARELAEDREAVA